MFIFLQKKVVGAFCGLGNSEANKSSISAQIQIFDDYEKIEKPGFKPKNFIRLENAKIESSYFSPSTSNTNSPAYSSTIASPQGGMRLSASPSPSVGSASSQSSAINGSELYAFTVATSNGEVHEFRTESENDRLRWVKLLQLLVMYPFSLIPEEPSTNPIKDNFRQALEAKQYGAGEESHVSLHGQIFYSIIIGKLSWSCSWNLSCTYPMGPVLSSLHYSNEYYECLTNEALLYSTQYYTPTVECVRVLRLTSCQVLSRQRGNKDSI